MAICVLPLSIGIIKLYLLFLTIAGEPPFNIIDSTPPIFVPELVWYHMDGLKSLMGGVRYGIDHVLIVKVGVVLNPNPPVAFPKEDECEP